MANASTVMFTGNVTHKLDPKSRVAIPAGWRAAQGQTLVMMEALYEGYHILKCFTKEAFAGKIDEIRQQAAAHGVQPGDVDLYIGRITGRCFDAEVSSQGKLLIPKQLRERMGLTDNVTIVGRSRHFEIWAPADFAATNSPDALAKLELDKMFHMLS